MTHISPSTTTSHLPLVSTKLRSRDAQVADIGLDSRIVRSRTWERLKFEVEYGRRRGTTANSYIVYGDGITVIDPPGESFTHIYLITLRQQVRLSTIDYIITSHVNSNRLATLKALHLLAPQAKIVCSHSAANSIKSTKINWAVLPVRTGESLDLGKGHNLQFVTVPTPRWPDGLCTYDPASQILYSDKLFGAHFCSDNLWDTHWRELNDDRRYYFDCLHAPQAQQVDKALDKFEAFSLKIIAPGHGPLVRHSLSRFRQDYRQWCQEQTHRQLRVAVLYASAYGNTATVANAIVQGLTTNDIAVELINCEKISAEAMTRIVSQCDGFIIGSPTLGGHAPVQIQTALGTILANVPKTKLAAVFGSYGWSGEAIDLLQHKLRDAGYRFGFSPIRVRFSPNAATLDHCSSAAYQFAQQLRKQSRQQIPRQAVSDVEANRTAQAMGRVIGALCVVTFDDHGTNRAILTTWVSQASFSPPGIMMALPLRDDAIANLQPNSSLVLNILKAGGSIRRQFSCETSCITAQNDLNIDHLDNAGMVLTDALAYLECTLTTRSIVGAHLLIYATVNTGHLLDSDGLTAIQHRKTGSQY